MKPLDSYDDANFLATTGTGEKVVVKVHNGADSAPGPREYIEATNACMGHLIAKGIHVNTPLRNKDGAESTIVRLPAAPVTWRMLAELSHHVAQGAAEQLEHVLRVLTYVEGTLMCDAAHTADMLRDLGRLMGACRNWWRGFHRIRAGRRGTAGVHTPGHRAHASVGHGADALSAVVCRVRCRRSPARHGAAGARNCGGVRYWHAFQVMARFEAEFVPLAASLPSGLIHNDGNDHNVVLDNQQRVTGIIDLGDMTCSPYVVELAVAIAYGAHIVSAVPHDPAQHCWTSRTWCRQRAQCGRGSRRCCRCRRRSDPCCICWCVRGWRSR